MRNWNEINVACAYLNSYLTAKLPTVRQVAYDMAISWAIARPVGSAEFEHAERLYLEASR